MPDVDMVIRGGTVMLPEGDARVDVAVIDGQIAAVGADVDLSGSVELDARGLHLLPGCVDPHVHFNEPGRTGWEGFASGTEALAVGGCTAFADMPLNSIPPTIDADSFDRKLGAARASSRVDFGLWGGLVRESLPHLDEMSRRGALGFKAFLCDSGVPEFPSVDDLTLLEGMRRCADLGAMVLLHAENEEMVRGLAASAAARGGASARDFLESRPAVAELEAIARAVFLAGETGCAVHIVHVSTGRGVRLVDQARRDGINVSCETCPHYLLLSEDDLERLGTVAKCAPPLRSRSDQEELWRLLASEVLPIVASDHSPCPPEMKRGGFLDAWGGISGCQSTLQLLLAHGVVRRGLDLATAVRAASTNAARRFGLAGKGAVRVGGDADVIMLDLSAEWRLTASELRYRHRLSPYVGMPVRGRMARVLLRGETVVENGRPVSKPIGRLLTAVR